MTVNKISKYAIAKEIKDWTIAILFGLWGGSFINDKFINPPKAENPNSIKINIDLGNTTEEEKLRVKQEAIRFMEEMGKLKQLSLKESIPWEDAPLPPVKD